MLGYTYLGAYGLGGIWDQDSEAPSSTFMIMGPLKTLGERVVFFEPSARVVFSEPKARVRFTDPDEEN